MRALIIDDHKVNRLYLRNLISGNFPIIKYIDEVETVSKALANIEQIDYDLIFLDMELPDGMGFDILKAMKDFVHVIVVSSHKEYAIEAFKHHVVDYLLKPVNESELKKAVNRVIALQERIVEPNLTIAKSDTIQGSPETKSGVMVNFKNEYVTINMKDILYIKALGKNSEIYMCDNKQYTSYKNLKEFESAMSAYLIRTHHSYLVNTECIVSYSKEKSQVLLSGGAEVPVSVRKREELFKKFRVF